MTDNISQSKAKKIGDYRYGWVPKFCLCIFSSIDIVCAMGVLIMEAEEIAKICEKLSLSDDDSPVVKVGAIVQKQGKRWTRWNDPEMMHEEKGVKNWDSVYRDPSPRPQIAMSCSRRKMAFLGSELRDLVTATTNRADWLEMKK
ncbi:hypothetical protein ACOSQ4_029136 [Xanthoceras sorbifolium]